MAKEITRVTTLRITEIIRTNDNNEGLISTDSFAKQFGDALKFVLGADNVVIDDVQDFELDKE